MKTRLRYSKGQITLCINVQGTGWGEVGDQLAGMTLMEGTGCWFVIDVRLHPIRTPNPYLASGHGEDFYNELLPSNDEQRLDLCRKLTDYERRSDGTFIWCTYADIVRGKTSVKGYTPAGYNGFTPPVWHSRAEGLALLKDIQAFWESHEGDVKAARINNPHLQTSAFMLQMQWDMAQRNASREQAKALSEFSGFGMMECNKALKQAEGDVLLAAGLLKYSGCLVAHRDAQTRQHWLMSAARAYAADLEYRDSRIVQRI